MSLPPGGLRLEEGRLRGSPARVRAELEGMARMQGHPALPRVVDAGEDWIAIEPLEGPGDPAEALGWASGTPEVVAGRAGELLAALPGETYPARALRTLLGTRDADRFLATPLHLELARGPDLGGIHAAWLRRAAGRTVALRWSRADPRGWPMDGAALQLFDGLPAGAPLCVLRLALEELALGRGREAEARAALQALAPRAERVRLIADAPPWLGIPAETTEVEARRWLDWDGKVVGGQRLRLRAEPPLRPAGARFFGRARAEFPAGMRMDDEGRFSATPDEVADWLVRDVEGPAVDGTCGVGCLAFALARNPRVSSILAVDTNPERLEMARHNARLYGVERRIRFERADITEVAPAGTLVLDPPWGGRDWERSGLGAADLPMDLRPLLERWARVVVKLPRAFDVATLPGLRWEAAKDLKMLRGTRLA